MFRKMDLFDRAVDEFDARVQQVGDEQWDAPTPCTEWNVRDLVNHLVYEDKWVPPLLDGKTIAEVGDEFEGDLLGDDPKGSWDTAAVEAKRAAGRAGVEERTVHLSYGDVPGRRYITELLADHVIHAWDLARGIDGDDKLDPELVEFVYERFKPHKQELRASGVYGDRVEVADDADTQTKLLALVGRKA